MTACAADAPSQPERANAARPPATSGPSLAQAGEPGFFFQRPLEAPAGRTESFRLHGEGVQIFHCEDAGRGPHWVHRLPEAELREASGRLLLRHGANLSFEHVDGSRLIGDVVDHVPGSSDSDLPWLLMRTRAYGKGALADITHVQRIRTSGGMPPSACTAAQLDQVLRVPFSADFVFFH